MYLGARTLKTKFENDFLIGSAVTTRTIKTHQEILIPHFNSVTCENEMKFSDIHPEEYKFVFDKADQIATFAREQGMKMRGHTFVWHEQTGGWIFREPDGSTAPVEKIYQRLKNHMQVLMNRYKDTLYCWDVVNDTISDEANSLLRDSVWLKRCGENYIDKAFQLAHEADEKALLFFNEYNAAVPFKRDKIVKVLKGLKERDVPVHGMGMQSHVNIYSPSVEEYKQAIEAYASIGLQVHITELDVSLFDYHDRRHYDHAPEELIEKQAIYYENIFRLFREYSDVIGNVTLWGVADDSTWLSDFPEPNRKNWPLLFDDDHKPKLAFEKLMQL